MATTGGTFAIYMGVPTVIIRDMNNMFINMQQQPQPRFGFGRGRGGPVVRVAVAPQPLQPVLRRWGPCIVHR